MGVARRIWARPHSKSADDGRVVLELVLVLARWGPWGGAGMRAQRRARAEITTRCSRDKVQRAEILAGPRRASQGPSQTRTAASASRSGSLPADARPLRAQKEGSPRRRATACEGVTGVSNQKAPSGGRTAMRCVSVCVCVRAVRVCGARTCASRAPSTTALPHHHLLHHHRTHARTQQLWQCALLQPGSSQQTGCQSVEKRSPPLGVGASPPAWGPPEPMSAVKIFRKARRGMARRWPLALLISVGIRRTVLVLQQRSPWRTQPAARNQAGCSLPALTALQAARCLLRTQLLDSRDRSLYFLLVQSCAVVSRAALAAH
jgi:hypothetical protein